MQVLLRYPKHSTNHRAWFCLGALTVLAMLGVLEWQNPYYFVADDNHRQYLPVILRGLEGFFATGRLPLWDAYSGLGMSLVNGGYPFTYPPLHLSYLLTLITGDAKTIFEWFAFLHLLAAYAVMYAAARRLRATRLLAACAAISFTLTGYHLILGRSWVNAAGLPLYLAAGIWLLTHLLRGERLTPRWALLAALTVGAFYHLGHAQYWVYGLCTTGIASSIMLAARPRYARENLPSIAAALLGGVAIASPLLWVQWLELNVAPLPLIQDIGVTRYLHFLLMPWLPGMPGFTMPVRLFSGGIYIAAAAALAAFLLVRTIRTRRLHPASGFVIAGILCLLLAMGVNTPLWRAMLDLPLFETFRYSDKWLPFAQACLAAGGIWCLARLARRYHGAVHAAALIAVAASLYNASHCTGSYSPFADKPYPPLITPATQLHEAQSSGKFPYRLFSAGPAFSRTPGFTHSLNNNYPSYYGIFSANRYNQRITESPSWKSALTLSGNQPQLFLQRYAVGTVTRRGRQHGEDNDYPPDYRMNEIFAAAEISAVKRNEADNTTWLRLDTSATDPLVGWEGADAVRGTRPLPLRFTALPDGMRIALPENTSTPGTLTAAFLHHPWMQATLEPDDIPLRVRQDQYHRMLLPIHQPGTSVTLALRPPWAGGLLIGIGLALAALALGWPLRSSLPAPGTEHTSESATH